MNTIKSNILFAAIGIAIGILAANSFNHSVSTQNNIENNNFNLSFQIPEQNYDSTEQTNTVDISFLKKFSQEICKNTDKEKMETIHNVNYVIDACNTLNLQKEPHYIM